MFGLEHLGWITQQKTNFGPAHTEKHSPAARKQQKGAADRIANIDNAGRAGREISSSSVRALGRSLVWDRLKRRNLGKGFRLMGRFEAELLGR